MFTILVLFGLGLVLGSFVGAQVWRLRLRQLREDKAAGELQPEDDVELKRLSVLHSKGVATDRSKCLQCSHTLAWYDLLPLISWVSTRGRCRYCKQFIGWFEPAIELSLASVFVVSYLVWPFEFDSVYVVGAFILWLIGLTLGAILWVYDKRWFLLPDRINFALIAVAALYALVHIIDGEVSVGDVALALIVFSGVYGSLYYFSRWQYGIQNTWVGFGDVKLSIALALFALEWQYAFLAILLANVLGTLLVLPGLATGKIKRGAHIPFGPLLLIGTALSVLFGAQIIDWYLGLFLL